MRAFVRGGTFGLMIGSEIRTTMPGILRGFAAGVFALWIVLPASAQDADAAATVDRLHIALLDIMQNAQTLGFAGRHDSIAPMIEQSFDLEFIARLSIGRYWPELSTEQRARMVDAFSRMSIATYAARFDGYSGERFETVSSKPARRGRVLVRTFVRKAGDPSEDVRLDYLLHDVGGQWRIVNVIANGVSDLSLKRVDYGVTMKTEGFDALIGRIDQQISDYAQSN